MKSLQSLLLAFGLIAAVPAWAHDWNQTHVTTTTITTDIYTTWCPEATTFTHGTKTYTATASETVTITDCPCTYTTSSTSTPTWVAPPPPVKNTTSTLPPVWHTTTVSEYTTYCPSPTVISHGNHTWTVTSATTLTISECPCTISYSTTPPWSASKAAGASTGTKSPTKTPVGPTAVTTGPVQAIGAAQRFEAGAGAIVAAGLAALLL